MLRAVHSGHSSGFPRGLADKAAQTLKYEKALTLQRPAKFVAAGVAAGWVFVLFDVLRRDDLSRVPAVRQVLGSLALYAVVGVVCGGVAWCLGAGERALTRRLSRHWPRAAGAPRVVACSALASLATWTTAFWAFTGPKASRASYASYGPYLLIGASAVAAGLFAWAVPRTLAALARGARLWPLMLVASALLLAAGISWVDLHFMVALYGRLHTALEVVTWVLLFLSAYLLFSIPGSARVDLAVRVGSGVGLAWTVLFICVHPARAWLDNSLEHVWLHPVYVGRMLQREQMAEVLLLHPGDWDNPAMRRLDTLRERYGGSTALDPAWQRPLVEPPAFRKAIRQQRGDRHDYNVLVYYVDTLRYDVASDPGIMPNVVGFSRHALDFRNAYTAGSDTLRALPSLTNGSYELNAPHRNNLLAVAGRTGRRRVIAIPQSSHEFLEKLDPGFKFDETLVVPDYAQERTDVWGYGADRSTAKGLVDRSLSWLRENPDKPFFMWVFNFDQHNWRELDKDYVHRVAREQHVPDQGTINWRYRVVATGIDAQFGRLIDGLHKLGRDRDTIVLFVADHGEGLGREGFWVHGVFLWQCLVRVPLMLRVPGMAPHAVDQKVSLVDVAPTLARYLDNDPDTTGYQGEDLLGYLVPHRPRRRLPLLISGFSQDVQARVGIVTPDQEWKLVLTLESGAPELHDLRAADPDASDVSLDHPQETLELLGKLVRSPIFPRADTGVAMQARAVPTPLD